MISGKTNNLILLIRLGIFLLIILINSIFGIGLSTSTPFFVNIFLIITIFSLMLFFAQNFINQIVLLYIQSIFDLLLITYIVSFTGYFDSPYIIFYSIVIIYMCFIDGIRAGIYTILLFLIISIVFILSFYIKGKQNILEEFIIKIFQYGLSFLIITFLTSYLHKIYSLKMKEQTDIEQKFRYLENLYKNILDNIDIGIILLSNNGFIISCNNAGHKILDVSGTLVGKKVTEMFDIKPENEIVEYNNKFIGYKFQPFFYDKKLLGELFIFQDVTEKENLKNKLQEQERLAILGQFAAIIAHEIKNPLGAIKGSFQIIKKDNFSDTKLFNIIDREISRLNNILNNLLMVTRENQVINEKSNIKMVINEFIDEITYYELFEDLSINFNCTVDNEPVVSISANELRQIIWNLVINSFQIKSDVDIDISLYFDNNLTILSYNDNGPGIPENIKEQIFKPFFTTKKTGTGLGLYVIKTICDKYNIKIKLFDNKEFSGFRIDFLFC